MGVLWYYVVAGVWFGAGFFLGYSVGSREGSITPSNNYEYGHPLYWD